ncbi:type II toxin-antitoxin system HipA family toxin [Elongatibacter sediminis]|uniref:Type II toxin-antitoxin system HipA family toxin n=1 Tax=Elongatibacter sediminis TaxID=3119006 RepID=A0AAW9RC27_9GAMM
MTTATVRLWGRDIGAVSQDADRALCHFEYDPAFRRSGIEVAPLTMPLSDRIWSFPALAHETYQGLPGLLADSLPDDFGNALIDAWLARQGRAPDTFNAVERLCYIGVRGMGALEYAPAAGPFRNRSAEVDVAALVDLASEILTRRNRLSGSLLPDEREETLLDILRVGTSAGGARAKAIIAWNRETGEVRSGQVAAGDGFTYWLLKFDGVSGNRDKELEDPAGYGLIEYAYYLMALEAGITMNECRLLQEQGRNHFMTRRFDRTDSGGKIHMQTLCAMAHFDYRRPGAYSYEQALQVIRELGLPMEDVEEQFRRMTFNIIGRNQDDHVKNIAFLMDRSGRWSLSPAYDMTYSHNPAGAWTSTHQMSLGGKRDHFVLEDFRACAALASMKRGRAEEIVREVHAAIARWPQFAEQAGVAEDEMRRIRNAQRLDIIQAA